jgi:hypothetical protein
MADFYTAPRSRWSDQRLIFQKHFMKRFNLRNLFTAAAMVALMFTVGCATPGEFGDRTVVVIYNQEPEKIIEATTHKFTSVGFTTLTTDDNEGVYERTGSTMQNLAYGSWMEGSIWEKATLTVEPYGNGASLLEAKVDRISNKNDEFFMDKKALSKRQRKPFQEMLDQIATELNGFPPGEDGK